MVDKCREKTKFVTWYGTYQFTVMPFGFINTPLAFQTMMDQVMKDYTFVRTYFADVVTFYWSLDERLVHLVTVLERISSCNLRIKLSKCFFAQRRVHLLGYVLNAEEIHVDQ